MGHKVHVLVLFMHSSWLLSLFLGIAAGIVFCFMIGLLQVQLECFESTTVLAGRVFPNPP